MSQASFRLRSFLIGMSVASLTWGASIYLYLNLTSHSGSILLDDDGQGDKGQSLPYIPLRDISSRSHVIKHFTRSQDFNDSKTNGQWKLKFKQLIDDGTMYKNSPSLVADLKSKVKIINGFGPKLELGKNTEGTDRSNDVDLASVGLIKTIEEKKERELGMKKHAFNAFISSKLSYHRNIPDTRHDRCSSIEYPAKLPSASVIICFYNEELHALLRSVHSVLDRANAQNLHEVILIDDFSDIDGLNHNLEKYIEKNFPIKVRLYKTQRREGLIRARIFGAKRATGDVLVFLDSHIEANMNWLDPMLARIKESSTTVVMPIIDIINADTFEYTASPLVKGGFNWGLHFKWDNIPVEYLRHGEDFVKPFQSPAMAGGLFAIDKKYFYELGEYDSGMDIWGGENIEISIRVWTCGGRLEIIPCSRVGHVFRRRRPYGSAPGEDSSLKNSIRVAEVWLDEYKEEFYKMKLSARNVFYGDITARKDLRKELHCKPFKWYLETIYPQLLDDVINNGTKPANSKASVNIWNKRKRNYISQFQINLTGTKLCVESEKSVTIKNSALIVSPCQVWNKKQRWAETDKHELILAELLCLDATNSKLRISKCHEMLGSQEWKLSSKTETPIYNMAAGLCIGLPETIEKIPPDGTRLTLEICSEERPFLKFNLLGYKSL